MGHPRFAATTADETIVCRCSKLTKSGEPPLKCVAVHIDDAWNRHTFNGSHVVRQHSIGRDVCDFAVVDRDRNVGMPLDRFIVWRTQSRMEKVRLHKS